MVRLILVVILLALSMTFFLQNREEEAVLHYFGITEETPIYKPILSAFASGLLIMGILLFPAWVKLRIELRRTRTALHLAEEELNRFRGPLHPPAGRQSQLFQGRESPEDDDVF